EQRSRLSGTGPPVGGVVALAGPWPPHKAGRARWSEDEIGWLLCDGRKIEGPKYAELRAVLGAAVLPDARGRFLRGVDGGAGRDPKRPGNTSQDWATALPKNQSVWSEEGEPPPALSTRINAGTNPNVNGAEVTIHDKEFASPGGGMKAAGKHSHTIGGGDLETRPVNVAMNWIIKF